MWNQDLSYTLYSDVIIYNFPHLLVIYSLSLILSINKWEVQGEERRVRCGHIFFEWEADVMIFYP